MNPYNKCEKKQLFLIVCSDEDCNECQINKRSIELSCKEIAKIFLKTKCGECGASIPFNIMHFDSLRPTKIEEGEE